MPSIHDSFYREDLEPVSAVVYDSKNDYEKPIEITIGDVTFEFSIKELREFIRWQQKLIRMHQTGCML